MFYSMTSTYTIDIGDEKKCIRQHFRTVHALIPSNYLVTDSNDEIVNCACNISGNIIKQKNEKTGKISFTISTHIVERNIDGIHERLAEHYLSSGSEPVKIEEVF